MAARRPTSSRRPRRPGGLHRGARWHNGSATPYKFATYEPNFPATAHPVDTMAARRPTSSRPLGCRQAGRRALQEAQWQRDALRVRDQGDARGRSVPASSRRNGSATPYKFATQPAQRPTGSTSRHNGSATPYKFATSSHNSDLILGSASEPDHRDGVADQRSALPGVDLDCCGVAMASLAHDGMGVGAGTKGLGHETSPQAVARQRPCIEAHH
jgi:hypothetical protein